MIRRFELTRFPARSPLPFAALPSISLIPSARFADLHRLVADFTCLTVSSLICENLRNLRLHFFL